MLEQKSEVPGAAPAPYRRKGKLIFGVLILLALLFLIWRTWPGEQFPAVAADKWQAVFLNNNQVYFGHLSNVDKNYAALQNIFYLRVAQQLQPPQAAAPTLNLVKLGGELHGPEDAMYIPKAEIMFWENMNASTSQVVQAINNYYASQPKQ